MGIHCVIGYTPVLLYEVQVRFAGFEKGLDIPALTINADELFFGKLCIRVYEYQPVLAAAFVADIHKFSRNAFPIFFDIHSY